MSEQGAEDKQGKHHKNDMYGTIGGQSETDEGVSVPIPSATVVLMRDGDEGVEVLMLRKNSKITFGGMWVFPGGKIDAEDYRGGDDLEAAARVAAVRETEEEAGVELNADNFVWFSHWTPPPGPQKRFATWFFAAHVETDHVIRIDDGEIKEHAWLRPADALAKHSAGELDLVPPTWLTLHHLTSHNPAREALSYFQSREPTVYATRVVKAGDGTRVALWHGDAGYENWDAGVAGDRHRLIMSKNGFTFENTVESD